MTQGGAARFFGWSVAWAAFVVAVLGWGIAFYGPPIYLHALQAQRGWSIGLVSAAVTAHYLAGSLAVANLPVIHARFGIVRTTIVGAALLGIGTFGWAIALEAWQLFIACAISGFGWAATGAVAINAFVSPWFHRQRPAALALAYNGASVGGIAFPPLWVGLIGWLGFAMAAALVGSIAFVTIAALARRYFSLVPADLGTYPDGDVAGREAMGRQDIAFAPLPGRALWTSPAFATYTAGFAVALFAQAGIIAHMFSLLVPALGEGGAGLASALAAACAIVGRTALGRLLKPGTSRRAAGALTLLIQAGGCAAFIAAGGTSAPLMLAGVTLFGLGIGIAITIGPLIAQAEFAATDMARAIALATAISQAAYAFAPVVFGLVRAWSGPDAAAFFITAGALQLLAAAIYVSCARAPNA